VESVLYQEFAQATTGSDIHVDLFGAAMLIARLRGGSVDMHAVARELDLIAEAVSEKVGERAGTEALIEAINEELFDELGFRGNMDAYDEPENSYLDRVIERRVGIPITLSLVYMEVAQRVGLRCDGVGFPGHFLVRCGEPAEGIYLDPFHHGRRLTAEELRARLASADLGGASPDSFLAGVTRRQILQRMLNNLHRIFRERRELERWMAVIELQLQLEPWNVSLIGERGMLKYRMGKPRQALADLENYVRASAPGPVSAGALRLLDQLRHREEGNEPSP
jgi:regulator of sirC expression with transglutaminase-like and TPR domain